MSFLINLLTIVQILVALFMIALILLQHGKGADMGAAFGSGASGSLFGASGSANALSRGTAICAAIFFSVTLALAYLAQKPAASGLDSRVIEELAKPNPATSAASIPGLVAPVAPAAPAASAVSVPALPAVSAPAAPVSGVQAIPNQ